jgi:serine/threonine-protein kinase RsbW
VCGGINGDRVWLRIRDEGQRFDPRSHAGSLVPPAAPGARDAQPVGGFGIFLAMRSVDEFDYEYVDGANQCTLTVYRA